MAPKRPLSSYLEFAKEKRATVLAEMGKISVVEVGKELGRRWQNLLPDEKEIFVNKHKDNKAKYLSELVDYKKKLLQSSVSQQSSSCELLPTFQQPSIPQEPPTTHISFPTPWSIPPLKILPHLSSLPPFNNLPLQLPFSHPQPIFNQWKLQWNPCLLHLISALLSSVATPGIQL